MKEKDLETWIYELSQTKHGRETLLYEHDLRGILEEPMRRQVSLGDFGIIDLLSSDENFISGYELKAKPIQYDDITQCCRYYEALQLVQRENNDITTVTIDLIIPYSDVYNKDLFYLISQLRFLRIQQYKVLPNKILFNPEPDYFSILDGKQFDTFNFNKRL